MDIVSVLIVLGVFKVSLFYILINYLINSI